jgi:Ca-activated chloride channel homolog
VRIARAGNVVLPDWAQPLIQSNDAPLGFVGSVSGVRIVGLTFDLQQSSLPLSSAFPILIDNVVQFLAPPSAAEAASLAPNTPAVIRPPPGVDRVVVEGPTNQSWSLAPSDGVVRFGQTDQVGLYRATEYAGSQVVAVEQFAVDLFSSAESDLRPRAALADHEAPQTPPSNATVLAARDLAPWLLWLAVPLLLGEWWWFHRR